MATSGRGSELRRKTGAHSRTVMGQWLTIRNAQQLLLLVLQAVIPKSHSNSPTVGPPLFQDVAPLERRMFGHYKCPSCTQTWGSAHSYRGFGQQCKYCKERYIPAHVLARLKRSSGFVGEDKAHRDDLCKRCKSGLKCRAAR